MSYIKLISGTVVMSILLLTGCSGHTKLDQLSSDVQVLDTKVDQLNNDVNTIRSDIQTTKDDAARANQRLDNQAAKYRK